MSRFQEYASKTVQTNEVRSTGPSFDTWPASLPQISYVTADGAFLCVVCANGGNGSEASTKDDTSDQWRIIGAQVNEEDHACAHCERLIPPGRPDERTIGSTRGR